MKTLTEFPEWQSLLSHYQQVMTGNMLDWFSNDKDRAFRFSLTVKGILLDYSRNRITDETLSKLIQLAHAVRLKDHIRNLFSGHIVNVSEKRPALHTHLRDMTEQPLWLDNENITTLIIQTKNRLYHLVDQIHAKTWRGVTGKSITDIINVGIGGSHLGPMMTIQALKDFAISPLTFHFISGVDTAHLLDVLNNINPETSLFIISSKSFSTLETLANFQFIQSWVQSKLGLSAAVWKQHFVAITAYPHKALEYGMIPENIFPLWDWVGGRYSVWSAVGLPLMLMIGKQHFEAFLSGAFQMDQHFLQADLKYNMPVIMALLGIWYINFFDAPAHAVMPYFYRLRYLIPYLQQTDMESNGKSVSLDGEKVSYKTGPVLFGEEGCHAQHAYHQLLHQGRHLIPVDFILPSKQHLNSPQQNILLASGLSQAEALLHGQSYQQVYENLRECAYSDNEAKELARHQAMPGNKPCNILFLDTLSPFILGALLALYEHKIYTQGVIWNINSFDQWGVELSKQLLPTILENIKLKHENNLSSKHSTGITST